MIKEEKTHREKFAKMADEKGIAITNLSLFGVSGKLHLKELYEADRHLNNIPLKRFDTLTDMYNLYNPRKRMCLSDGCCIYKELLRQIAEG